MSSESCPGASHSDEKHNPHHATATATTTAAATSAPAPAVEVIKRDFTFQQLRDYDGREDLPIYIALKAVVYDVSKGREFYGKGAG